MVGCKSAWRDKGPVTEAQRARFTREAQPSIIQREIPATNRLPFSFAFSLPLFLSFLLSNHLFLFLPMKQGSRLLFERLLFTFFCKSFLVNICWFWMCYIKEIDFNQLLNYFFSTLLFQKYFEVWTQLFHQQQRFAKTMMNVLMKVWIHSYI